MSTGSSFNPQHEISDQVRAKFFIDGAIPHPNREQALKRARLTAGFPNIVNGQRIDSSRPIKISDPVTGEELASVTDTQKAGLDQGDPGCKGSVSPLEQQDLERATGSSCECHGRAQSSYR
jgi:hypothetical protein